MTKLTIRNSFGYKDQMKADISNKFIGRVVQQAVQTNMPKTTVTRLIQVTT